MLLLRAREKMMERFRPLITAHGLTEQQWRVIRALNEHGPMEPRHISDICTISSPSMAGVLARMESMELVTKERFAEDQRRVLEAGFDMHLVKPVDIAQLLGALGEPAPLPAAAG